jgi:hypothetical protein
VESTESVTRGGNPKHPFVLRGWRRWGFAFMVFYFVMAAGRYYDGPHSWPMVALYAVFAANSLVAWMVLVTYEHSLLDGSRELGLREKLPDLVGGLLYIGSLAAFEILLRLIVA